MTKTHQEMQTDIVVIRQGLEDIHYQHTQGNGEQNRLKDGESQEDWNQ